MTTSGRAFRVQAERNQGSHLSGFPRGGSARTLAMLAGASAIAIAAATSASAQALPTGGSVAAGSATITSPKVGTLNINQSSDRAILNWQSFSVGQGGTVNFNQPSAASATLNRVTGTTPSTIAGEINAPGTVVLVNPNGIAITRSGVVNVGSFAASTLDIKNDDFVAGRYKFFGNGSSAGVTNKGRINVSDGGFAALLGGRVANDGVISARLGKVGLASGEMVTLDLSGDGFLSVAVPSNQLGNLRDRNGKPLVSNRGKIVADGGTVVLSAATASNILRDAVNVPGSIRANSVGGANGHIVIGGGYGRVTVTGKLAARGKASGTTGGKIDIAGADIMLRGATLDASGSAGGGKIRIGGDSHGQGDFQHAQSLSIDAATTLRADATDRGNGGTIVAWSNGQTTAKGTFRARGGVNGGDGGSIETSGHSVDFTGISVNASSASGKAGTWLVDPTDLTIDSAAALVIGTALGNGTSVTLQTNADGSTSGPGVTSAGNGDIVVSSNITWSSSSTAVLTLQSVHDINIDAGICCGALTLLASGSVTTAQLTSLGTSATTITAGGNITINGSAVLAGATSFTAGGNIVTTSQTVLGSDPTLTAGGNIQASFFTTSGGATLSAFGNVSVNGLSNSGGGTITLQADSTGTGAGTVTNSGFITAGGANVAIYYNPTSYTSPTTYSNNVSGGSVMAYMLVNSYANLKAINNNLSGNYALGRDIDASASGRDNSGFGWSGLGSNPNGPGTYFTGSFDGQNHVISGLAGSTAGALFYGIGSSGTISNLGVVNANLLNSGGNPEPMGIIARYNAGTLSNVYTSGTVAGGLGSAGGLVGENSNGGVITGGSYSTASVSADGGSASAGGLLGQNYGTIQNSYSDGSVHAVLEVGGIVGINWGTVTNVYSLSSVGVSNGGDAGGIAGMNGFTLSRAGVISYSWAAGSLPCACGVNHVGGIVGLNDYIDRINLGNNAPDLNDWNSNPSAKMALVYNSYWDVDTTHATTAYSTDYIPYGPNSPYVTSSNLYNLGALSTNASLGANPYQLNSYSYFDSASNGNGFGQNWFWVPGARPFVAAEYSTTIRNSHQLQLVDTNAAANYRLAKDITFTNDGMWSSAGFSPITGLSETTLTYLTYVGKTLTGATGTTTTQSGNVITTVIINRDFFDQAPQLVSTSYAVAVGSSAFSGTFNGNGHTITGLTENLSGTDGGLFSVNAGTIENLGLIDPSITTHDTSAAGTIAAFNSGTIINSWASSNTGGLSLNAWNIKAVGGLVGYNSGQISQSFANVAVAGVYQSQDPTTPGSFFDNDGGLVGVNDGTISNSYAVGGVLGNGSVGGLVGSNGGIIQNTYTTGQVGNNWLFGVNSENALVGNNVGMVTGSFWDSTTATAKSGAGTGLTTTQMQDFSTYASVYPGWVFNHVWAPPNKAGQAGLGTAYYPELYADTAVVFVQPGSTSVTYGQSVSVSATMAGGVVDYKFDRPADSMAAPGVTTTATQTSNVGSYAVTANVGSTLTSRFGTTYRVINVPGTLTVTPRSITVAADSESKIYDNTTSTDPTLSYHVSSGNLVNGDTLSGTLSRAAGQNAGTYAINQGTLANSNYAISFTGNSFTISQRSIGITADAQEKVYDNNGATDPALTYHVSVGSYASGDSAANVFSGALTRAAGENAGAYAITQGSLASNSNYALSFTGNTFTIDKRQLTVSLTGSVEKTYDGTTSATLTQANYVTSGNILPSDAGNVSLSNLPTSGTFDTRDAGAGKTVTVSLNGLLTGSAANNYTLGATASGAIGQIDQAHLTIAAVSDSKTYDGTTASSQAPSVSGLQTGDHVANLSQVYDSRNAGNRTLSVATGFVVNDGNNGQNYIVDSSGTAAGSISKATLTINATSDTKTYDSTTNTSQGPTYSNLQSGDGLTGLSQAFASKNVLGASNSTLSVTGYTLNDGNDGNNYNVVTNTAQGTINKATLTLSAQSDTKTYDGMTASSQSPTISGLQGNTDNVSGLTQTFDSRNAGTRTLSVANGYTVNDGNNGGNYDVVTNTASGTINKATLTISATSDTKTYDSTTSSSQGPTYSNLQTGDQLTGLVQAFASKNVLGANGSTLGVTYYTLTDGSGGNNYIVVTNTASGTINKATLTLSAVTDTKVYDGTVVSSQSPTISGLQANTDNVSNLTQVFDSRNAGSRTLSVNSYTVNDRNNGGNYSVITNTASGTINKAVLLFTANLATRTYGAANPALSGQITGYKNGETAANFGGEVWSTPANAQSNVGAYAIAGGFANAASNYVITQAAGNGNAFGVTPAPIVVIALGGTSVYGSQPTNPGLSASGLQNGQTVAALTGLSNSFGITQTTSVGGGPYTLQVAGTLSNPNYAITQRVNGTWTVTPAQITVTADGQTKLVGATDPALTYRITSGQLFNGDLFSGALTRDSGESVGDYAIRQGTLALSSNYQLTYVGANLTIKVPPSQPSSQFPPPTNPPSINTTTMDFSLPTPSPVSFDGGGGTGTGTGSSNKKKTDTSFNSPADTTVTGSIGNVTTNFVASLATNHGLIFPPISQFDAKQYSNGALPGYVGRDGEATVFTMLDRAVTPNNNPNAIFIDGFWNASAASNQGANDSSALPPKLTFSDGYGHNVAPADGNAFPITAGIADFAALLQSGPVMIKDAPAPDGSQSWMLATGITTDGKGIVANDPVTGRQVILSYDPATRTVGGVTTVYDPKTSSWVAVANLDPVKLAGDVNVPELQVSSLQSFTPAGYLAVTIH